MTSEINYGKILNGKDFNFFKKVAVSSGSFQTNCDALIWFTTNTVHFLLEGTGVVEYSFNGNTLHGDMDSTKDSKDLIFRNRSVTKIWFRVVSGSPTVRVEAW